MALRSIRDGGTTPQGGVDCDFCRERLGRNPQVRHVLEFRDVDELKRHLGGVFGNGSYVQGFLTQLWFTAHQIYGAWARGKYMPLWMVYFEEHGITVKNRGEEIMEYRKHNAERRDEEQNPG
jgi:hypothetical protein